MSYVLKIRKIGKKPHFAEGFETREEAEKVKLAFMESSRAVGKKFEIIQLSPDPPKQLEMAL
jgi:hypothetical protein